MTTVVSATLPTPEECDESDFDHGIRTILRDLRSVTP